MSGVAPLLPPRERPLPVLERLIALAEADARSWASRVERLASGAERNAGYARDRLVAAENRLRLLHRSRRFLLTGALSGTAEPSP